LLFASGLTLARQVLPGKTYMLTRRVTRPTWLLRPDADGISQQVYLYALGYNANEHGILLHNLSQMSSNFRPTLSLLLRRIGASAARRKSRNWALGGAWGPRYEI